MAVPAPEREVWMRTRGAEIYAAGGFFAFPVEGPFGCDASRDGTLSRIARLTAFYQRHRDLYLRSRFLGSEAIHADVPLVSLAASWLPDTRTLILHAINRDVQTGVLRPRGALHLRLPIAAAPSEASVVSPDFEGVRRIATRIVDGSLEVTLPGLEACSVILLRYRAAPDTSRLSDPIRVRPDARWVRPTRNEFVVHADGAVDAASDLEGFLQGTLHKELRNPPTFLVDSRHGAQVLVHVRAVATLGARLQFRVDGRVVRTVDLPDLDGKNDASAREYDRTYACAIPAGRHRVTVDNIGGDWALVEWYQFGQQR
jgi:hypothetical protein